MAFPAAMGTSRPMYDLSNAFNQPLSLENDDEFMEVDGEIKTIMDEFEEVDETHVSLQKINEELKASFINPLEEWETFKREKSNYHGSGHAKTAEEVAIPAEWANVKLQVFTLPEVNYLEQYSEAIEQGVISVLMTAGIPSDPHFNEITKHVSKVANEDKCVDLLKRVRRVMEEYLPKIFEELINCADVELISDVAFRTWSEFKRKMVMMDRIFYPANGRCGLRILFPIRPVSTAIMLKLFTDKFELLRNVSYGLVHLVNAHRRNAEIDVEKLKFLVAMLCELRCYETVFEPILQKETEKFYMEESKKTFDSVDVPKYVDYCNQRIQEENVRADTLLCSSSQNKLFKVLRKCMVDDFAVDMVKKGSSLLFENEMEEDIKKLFNLLDESRGGLAALKVVFSEYIFKVGKVIVSDDTKDKTLVDDLLKFKHKTDHIIVDCFNGDDKFKEAEKDAFTKFINTRPNKPAELIAKYMDLKMRAVNKTFTEKAFDDLMDQVIFLFRFIQGKDVFEAFYKRDLAKRLLMGKSASVDAEKAMLMKLRTECGGGFTSKLEGMFRDIDVSKDILVNFKSHVEKLPLSKYAVDFNVNVLTMGFWPNYTYMDVHIPEQLCQFQQAFNDYYVEKNRGRKLTWQYSLANALMVANFSKGKKELDVSLFQALVLLMFNDKDEFTFKEIQDFTRIEENELVRTLLSLVGKTPILTRTKGERAKISPDEIFNFNDEFVDKNYKIRISQVQMKETEKEKEQTEEEIQQDRVYVIDANIVRLMKQLKQASHNQLISELLSQLRFVARPQDLKKRIESLIEREYMSRDVNDAQLYKYVA